MFKFFSVFSRFSFFVSHTREKKKFGIDRVRDENFQLLVRLDLRDPLTEVAEIFERLRPVDLLVRPEFQ